MNSHTQQFLKNGILSPFNDTGVFGSENILHKLVAYWKLEESSGSRIDATGRGNDLAVNGTGGVDGAPGISGNAAKFVAASGQYLSHVSNTDLGNGGGSFTVLGWVNFTTNPTYSFMICKQNNTGTNQREYYLGIDANGLSFCVNPNGTTSPGDHAVSVVKPATGGWHFVIGWHDANTQTINLQVDNGTVVSASHTTGVYNGSSEFWLGGFDSVQYLNGLLDAVGKWNRVLTSYERAKLYNNGLGLQYPFDLSPLRNMIFDGDSLTRGYPIVPDSYPSKIVSSLTGVNRFYNLGIDAQKLSTMLANVNTNVVSKYNSLYSKNISIIWGGVNDLQVNGYSGSSVYADLQSYCTIVKSAGFKTIVSTILPDTNGGRPASFDAQRIVFNDLLKNNHSFSDGFVDTTSDTRLENANDTTYFYSDKVHLIDAGYIILANLFKNQILLM
jgi:hypothetical protein